MSPRASLWLTGALAALGAATFAWYVRLPLPFTGFSVLTAAVLAFIGTLALTAWLPRSWVWSETERLRHAFQARHGVSGQTAQQALEAIAKAHARAETLRRAARSMRDDVADTVGTLADRLDAAAREIFYSPDRQRDLRKVLVRSELIEDAATAHATLRQRKQTATEDASREKLLSAVAALNAAFDETELLAARGLLQEVSIASGVAERLLTPRRALTPSDPSS